MIFMSPCATCFTTAASASTSRSAVVHLNELLPRSPRNRSAGTRREHTESTLRFAHLRQALLSRCQPSRLAEPLGHWSLPSDRRLPRSLLHRRLDDLLQTSFDALTATPGIGRGKIRTFLQLLERVLQSDGSKAPPRHEVIPPATPTAISGDPSDISELQWSARRALVVERGVGDRPLGYFVRSLTELPRGVWETPISLYLGLSLAEIRRLKLHGEKRVRAVLRAIAQVEAEFTLRGRFQAPLATAETWLEHAPSSSGDAADHELRSAVFEPLSNQLALDLGSPTDRLVRNLVGLDGTVWSVRRAARELGVTRSRIYQLLHDVVTAVAIRLPGGREAVSRRLMQLPSLPSDPTVRRATIAAAKTLFCLNLATVP